MPVRDYILALVTLVSLALPVSGMAQLAPELLDKQGFPKLEILDNDLKTSHCLQKSICHIMDANSSMKIPDVIVKSFAHGEQKNWAGDMLKRTILYLMSLPEVLKYLDEAMPLECKQLTS